MNSKVLNYLSEKKDSFMDWFETNKTNIKTNATKVIATGLTLAALTNMAGCNNQLVGSDGTHSKHPMISDEQFTGETQPPVLEVRPKEEITKENITAEDVLAAYDQLSLLALHHFWADAKERWGDDFNNLTASFVSITPQYVQDYDFTTDENRNRMKAYYTYDQFFDGVNHWQMEELSYAGEPIYTFEFNIDIGYKGEVFDCGAFTTFGMYQSDFLPIANGFKSEPFNITASKLEEIYGGQSLITNFDHNKIGYSSFIIDRSTILNIQDMELLWSLYHAAHNSIYSINFRDHYNKYNDIEMEP